MSNRPEAATFNVKAVVMATGLTPDTLRAWERRYGLPQPSRSTGRHRLYTQRDIDTLKWLIARQRQGLSISQAVDLWRHLEASGQDPLETEAFPPVSSMGDAQSPEALKRAWITHSLAFDEQAAEDVLSHAFALFPVEVVCFDVLFAGLRDIGASWQQGRASVQQEHFASALAMRRLSSLLAAAAPPTRGRRALVACAPDDEHAFPALLMALLLRRRGWDAIYLGARVPVERLEETLAKTSPHLVLLSAQMLITAATLRNAAQLVAEHKRTVAFGGRVFALQTSLEAKIAGHYLGHDPRQAIATAERLLLETPPNPTPEPISDELSQALAHYRQQRPHIEARLQEMSSKLNLPEAYFATANSYFPRSLDAALTFGDRALLESEIAWVQHLLAYYEIPEDLLGVYLSAYLQAAKAVLDKRGAPLIAWLTDLNRE